MTENLEHCLDQITLARTEIKNLRQQISALKHEHLKEIKCLKDVLGGLRCSSCGDAATKLVQNHNDIQPRQVETESIQFRPIGVIETSFQNKRAVPRQPTIAANVQGTLVIDTTVFNNPEHALIGLQEFSHIWIIFHFHATESNSVPAKVTPPRLGGERRGVFSTRSPHRPCPIGLSLVKIHRIEGNKIHFYGVDMVNGTPVLDIKPYIPQYDYPGSFDPSSIMRPRTEGISDIADTMVTMSVEDDLDELSINPRSTQPIGIDTDPSQSLNNISSPEQNIPNPISPETSENLSRIVERGAPDGQERCTPPSQNNQNDGIRIASWISNPPSQAYEVLFTTDALNRLNELIGDRANTFKANIESLLSEDPRSQYVRSRYPDHEYSCALEDLSISCIFDSTTSICTIIAVRSADEMQS